MLRKSRTTIVFAVVAVIVGIGWWQLRELRSQAFDRNSGGVGLALYPGGSGIRVPEVKGKTIAGEVLSLTSLRGHVVVLNVWGSWCAPCRSEAPGLAKVSRETAQRGVRFVGIDVRDNAAAGSAFERAFAITYPSFDDQDGLVLASFTGIIPVSAVPSTLVIDKFGIIRARNVGEIDATTLRGLIDYAEKGK